MKKLTRDSFHVTVTLVLAVVAGIGAGGWIALGLPWSRYTHWEAILYGTINTGLSLAAALIVALTYVSIYELVRQSKRRKG